MPYTLLLADDSVTIQRVIELTFADEDVTVVAVSDGDQAIARLESSPPDIVLADIGMPGRNGYEVAKYVKQSLTLSHIPVVLLTGAFEPVDQARATEAGCDGVLAKPFEPQLVISRVKDLLAKSSHQMPASLDDNLAPPAADRWTTPTDHPLTPGPAAAEPAAQLDDYFDRLDAAFQTLSGPAPVSAAPKVAPADAVPDIDWFGTNPDSPASASEPWDLPAPAQDIATTDATDFQLSYASPPPPSAFDDGPAHSVDSEPLAAFAEAPVAEIPVAEPAAILDEPVTAAIATPAPPLSAPVSPPAPPAQLPRITALPPLADAFAAILAAEQGEAGAADSASWPATTPATDELVEQVTRRVLDQLSDNVVRDSVSQIAERLVREEIERIKASIK